MIARWLASVREVFLLSHARQAARSRSVVLRQQVELLVAAATRRSSLTSTSLEEGATVATLSLARPALLLLADAYRVSRGLEPPTDLARLTEHDPHLAAAWSRVERAAGAADPLYLDQLDEAGRRELGAAYVVLGRWLRAHIDTGSVAYINGTSVGRIGAVVLVLALLAIRLLTPANLARGKLVTQSSAWPGAPPSSVLVDGKTDGSHGPGSAGGPDYLHTAKDGAPWAMVDLGKPYRVRRVKIYNRNDSNFDDGLPLSLELSEDGKTFATVAERTTHFGATIFDPPWEVTVDGRRARFVRVRARDYLALSEVEVFGR